MIGFLRDLANYPWIRIYRECAGDGGYCKVEWGKTIKDYRVALKANPDDKFSET